MDETGAISRNSGKRQPTSLGRQDLYLHAYLQLGATRSLRLLRQELARAGVSVSLATLKRYSKRFRWQERMAEVDADARKRQREQDVGEVMAMHDRHAQLARAMQGAAGSALQRLLANDVRLAGLKAAEIARLIDLGLRAERTAVGVATDRRDIGVETWNDVVVTIAQLFTDVNDEPDPRTRAKLFAKRLDRLVDERLAAGLEREG